MRNVLILLAIFVAPVFAAVTGPQVIDITPENIESNGLCMNVKRVGEIHRLFLYFEKETNFHGHAYEYESTSVNISLGSESSSQFISGYIQAIEGEVGKVESALSQDLMGRLIISIMYKNSPYMLRIQDKDFIKNNAYISKAQQSCG